MDLVDKFIYYVNNNDLSIYDDLKITDITDFNVAIMNLLDWMKLQYKRYLWVLEGKKDIRKPLKLSLNTSWEILLNDLIENNMEFSMIFSIEDNSIIFSKCLTEEETKQLCKKVYDEYNPIRYTK